ncbi:MAG: DUF2063 domain-containing protein [Steroidobacteraceae bacterium]|nr:DUF2063 domain-containing protein [Steroidobacteraceae bacterium]
MPNSPTLLELQRGFAAAIGGRDDGVRDHIEARGLEPAERLAIYRHANQATVLGALGEAYPTVRALVGEAYFEHVAAHYRSEYPSRTGNLQDLGARFAEFLDARATSDAHPPYLGDCARLDWLRQTAALAADAAPIAAPGRAAAAASSPESLRVRLHPSLRVLRSAYPLLSIYRWCQSPSSTPPRLDQDAESVLLWREGDEVAMTVTSQAAALFVESLLLDTTLGAAATVAVGIESQFDAAECLGGLLARDLIVGFEK